MGDIVQETSREVFVELVREATDELHPTVSPMAVGYLVDLLETRLRAPLPHAESPTLAEALFDARGTAGSKRIATLRAVGDRSLFVAGFFGDSLWRRGISDRYYAQIGCEAYLAVSSCLPGDAGWPELFRELAERFPALVEVLGEIGDRARGGDCGDALRIYAHYTESGSARDRRRLERRGIVVPDDTGSLH